VCSSDLVEAARVLNLGKSDVFDCALNTDRT